MLSIKRAVQNRDGGGANSRSPMGPCENSSETEISELFALEFNSPDVGRVPADRAAGRKTARKLLPSFQASMQLAALKAARKMQVKMDLCTI